ncbi:hypothetical protein NKH77_36940 [Streptomyces sp. M19]
MEHAAHPSSDRYQLAVLAVRCLTGLRRDPSTPTRGWTRAAAYGLRRRTRPGPDRDRPRGPADGGRTARRLRPVGDRQQLGHAPPPVAGGARAMGGTRVPASPLRPGRSGPSRLSPARLGPCRAHGPPLPYRPLHSRRSCRTRRGARGRPRIHAGVVVFWACS